MIAHMSHNDKRLATPSGGEALTVCSAMVALFPLNAYVNYSHHIYTLPHNLQILFTSFTTAVVHGRTTAWDKLFMKFSNQPLPLNA
jgi:hypothetical protein